MTILDLLKRDFSDANAIKIDAKVDEFWHLYENRNHTMNIILAKALYALDVYHINTPDGELNTIQYANDVFARWIKN